MPPEGPSLKVIPACTVAGYGDGIPPGRQRGYGRAPSSSNLHPPRRRPKTPKRPVRAVAPFRIVEAPRAIYCKFRPVLEFNKAYHAPFRGAVMDHPELDRANGCDDDPHHEMHLHRHGIVVEVEDPRAYCQPRSDRQIDPFFRFEKRRN